jgi:hypothetical protein
MPPTITDYSSLLGRAPTAPARPAPTRRPDPCADDTPACPACGGLQCLCRPRFFPGQLLTDEDLNRLQRYVIEKNRLHARYLHGWGVACGLEVVCDPCGSSHVVVRAGYALSPCGDDIVVCNDHSVNVCELIDQCRPQSGAECDPPYQQAPRECRDGTERWALSVCYDERPSRGITALTGSTDSACRSGCGCGGSGTCGCKGGAGCTCGTKAAPAPAKRKAYQPQCEPTQVCEGYRFVARRLPPEAKTRPQAPATGAAAGNADLLFAWMHANRAKLGPMMERLLCCVIAALELRASFNTGQKYPTPGEAARAYDEYRDALLSFARSFAVHNCAFLDKLTAVTVQEDERIDGIRKVAGKMTVNHEAVMNSALTRLDATLFELVAECFCSALLPACPPAAADNCVPLAVLTVRTRDCSVVEICNWQERKLLITWQTVGYWLSWLPWHKLRESIARLCCADSARRDALWPMVLAIGGLLSSTRSKSQGAAAGGAAPAPGDALDAGKLSVRYAKLQSGDEADAPEWASLVARLAEGNALAPLAGREAVKKAELGDLEVNLGIHNLREQVARMQKTLDEYQGAMEGLGKIMKGKGG